MKFLLAGINAKYIHSNPAIRSLKAGAGVENHKYIDLAEYTINQKVEEILADLYRRKPDIIGFSCYIWNIETVRALLPELPKLLPDTEVWLGGPEVSFDGEDLLDEYPGVRGIMAGEGEETFRELLNYYREIFREKAGRASRSVRVPERQDLAESGGLFCGKAERREESFFPWMRFLFCMRI